MQGMEPNNTASKRGSTNVNVIKTDLQPIKDAVEELIDRVNDGDASPRAIVAELNRVAQLIDNAEGGN